MVRRHSRCSVLVVLLCALSAAAFAQQETATISGTITDSTGAVVPRAVVVVTNVQTGITVRTTATESGSYLVPSLRPGDYSVAVESKGFQKTVRTGVTLQVAQVARIDVTLQTGGLTEAVEVVGATPLLETQTSSRGLVIDQKKIVELPLERPRLQPAGAALARRAPRHSPAGERQFQGRAQRQRQPHLQQRLPARRRRQHLVLEFVPRRERAAGAAVDRGAAGIQDSDECLFRRVRPQLGRRRQRDDQVGHQHACAAASTSSSATTRSTRTTFSRTRSERPSRSASATSSAARSADQSCRTGRSGSATTRACAISKAFRASGWCRPRRRRPGCSATAVVDPFAGGPAGVQPERAGPMGDSARALGSGRRGDRRTDSRSERRRIHDLRVDAGHRHAAGSVRRPRRPSDLAPRMTLFGRYSFVDTQTFRPRAAAGPGGRARSTTRSARTTIDRRGSRSA